jgi:hypothetical protein
MTISEFNEMQLDELRRYMLTNRDDVMAFQVYVDRSKASGRMITIDPTDPNWEQTIQNRLRQNSDN